MMTGSIRNIEQIINNMVYFSQEYISLSFVLHYFDSIFIVIFGNIQTYKNIKISNFIITLYISEDDSKK